jgi:plastocyanin
MNRALTALVACAVVAFAAGCGSSGSSVSTSGSTPSASTTAAPAAPAPAAGSTVEVKYQNLLINPPDITVKVGTKIRWTNFDSTIHNVTSQSGPQSFTSPPLNQGSTYGVTLTKPGVVHYICTFHPSSMIGTITVVR